MEQSILDSPLIQVKYFVIVPPKCVEYDMDWN